MTRAFDEWLAQVADTLRLPVPTLALLSAVAAIAVALLWYFWPRWLPWTWDWSRSGSRPARAARRRTGSRRGLGRLRWRLRWRRRRRVAPDEPEALPADHLPDLPAATLALTADQLAAAGRYAEAVRERLRAILRGLVERQLLPADAGWTVMELANAAARLRPGLAAPLNAAVGVFSEIWYGLRPATAADDAALRTHAAAVAAVADAQQPTPAGTGRSA